jgi:hypothetical protein
MHESTSKEELQKMAFGDARLVGIAWSGDADLQLSLCLAGQEPRTVHLFCRFVTQLQITLSFGDLSGAPLTWDATFDQTTSGWHVAFDFAGAPDGAITFACADLEISDVIDNKVAS